MKFSGIIRWRVAGLLVAMLIIVGLPYVVTRQNARDTQLADAWVTHSTAVRSLTYRIGYVARDSEAANYRLLTGDVNAVAQARALRAATETPDLFRQLRAMTRDNPEQQTLIGALENSVNGRITLMRQTREQLQRNDAVAARNSLREAGDLFPLSAKIESIVQGENQLLALRKQSAVDRTRTGEWVLAITALAQLLLLAIIVVASERQIGQRRKAEDREGRAVERSRLIFQAVREPIALFDANLGSLLVNNAFSELYGEDLQ
ncbi:MAG: CHASE3 domain-containing protein, partial [Rhodanobacter sp.]